MTWIEIKQIQIKRKQNALHWFFGRLRIWVKILSKLNCTMFCKCELLGVNNKFNWLKCIIIAQRILIYLRDTLWLINWYMCIMWHKWKMNINIVFNSTVYKVKGGELHEVSNLSEAWNQSLYCEGWGRGSSNDYSIKLLQSKRQNIMII